MRYSSVLLVSSALVLSGCVAAVAGIAGTTGYTAAQERTMGNAVDDASIQTQIKTKYFHEHVDHLFNDINTDVYEGRVLLKGRVLHPDHRVEAVRIAWSVEGVKEVISEIEVEGQPLSIKRLAQDEWLTAQINGKLLITKGIASINYNVDTVNGVVYLIGVAASRDELDKVLDITRRVEGVDRVVSHVRIRHDPLRNVPENGVAQPAAK